MSGVVLSYAYTLAQAIVGIIYVPLLLSGLGAGEYGLYQLIGSIVANLSILQGMFSGGVTRFYCKYYSEGNIQGMENTLAISRKIYRVVTVVAILIGALVIPLFQLAYDNSLTSDQILEGSFMIPVLIMNLIVDMNNTINVAVINAHERFAFLKGTQLASVLAQPVAIILLLNVAPYALTVVLAMLFFNMMCAFAQRVFARRHLGARIENHPDKDHLLKGLLRFSSTVVFVVIADQIFWNSNQLILGYLYGTSTVALYSIASQICMAYMPIGTAISNVFMPKVSEMFFAQHDMSAISDLFTKVGRIAIYPLLLVLVGFIIFGSDFIRIWVGERYAEAYYITLVLIIPFTVDLIQNLAFLIMQVVNKYAFRGYVYIGMALVNIVFVIIVAPVYGALGAAFVTGFSMLVGNGLVMNIYYRKKLRLDIRKYWKNAARVAFPLVVYGLVGLLAIRSLSLAFTSWGELILGIMVFTIGYCLVAYLCSMNEDEKNILGSLVSKLRRK